MSDIEVVITEGPDAVVMVEEEPDTTVTVTLSPPAQTVEVEVPGPAGPPGAPGEPGPPGSGGDLAYAHSQVLASDTWAITHSLGKYPSVTVVDSGQNIVEGDVQYIDTDSLVVTFSVAFSGAAYLN